MDNRACPEQRRRARRSRRWSKAALSVLAFGDLSSWYHPAWLPISHCRVEFFYEGTGALQRATRCRFALTPDGGTESHLSCNPAHTAAAGRCWLCPWHGQVQGETRCHLRQENFADYYWLPLWSLVATGKPVSSAGMEDEPVKCNKHFTQQFPDKKYCYPKPMHRWEEPAGFLGGDESRVWVSYLFLLKLFQDFSPKMG